MGVDEVKEKWKRVSELEQRADIFRRMDLYFRRFLVEDSLINNSSENILGINGEKSLDYEEHMRKIQVEFDGVYRLIHRRFSKKVQRCYDRRNKLLNQ